MIRGATSGSHRRGHRVHTGRRPKIEPKKPAWWPGGPCRLACRMGRACRGRVASSTSPQTRHRIHQKHFVGMTPLSRETQQYRVRVFSFESSFIPLLLRSLVASVETTCGESPSPTETCTERRESSRIVCRKGRVKVPPWRVGRQRCAHVATTVYTQPSTLLIYGSCGEIFVCA